MNFFQRRAILKSANYLDLKPIRLYKEEITEDNQINILIPKFKNAFAVKYIMPKMKSPEIKLKLDELGSAAWMMMNGKTDVGSIARGLDQKFGEKVQPVEERLTKFLTQLYEQRLITFNELKGD